MAIGDAGAAKGLVIYPATQDIRLGYQNDNQRADDIAAAMTRLDTAESNLKAPTAVVNGSAVGGAVGTTQTVVVGTAAVTALAFKRVLSIDFAALVSAGLNGHAMTLELQIQPGGVGGWTTLRSARTNTADESFGGHYNYTLVANATANFRVVASMDVGSSSITSTSTFTYLTILVPVVA